MRSRVYETVLRPSVCLSVCPSHTAAARRYCEFAVVSPAAKIYRSIAARPVGRRSAAAAPQLRAVAGCIKRQCHIVTTLTNQQNHKLTVPFYPRDAMLARVLAMALCLCMSAVGTEFPSQYPPHTHTHGDPHGDSHTHGRPAVCVCHKSVFYRNG